MKRKERLPELLAPAGSYEAMLAAVEAGADAVYLAGARFGARAYARNFTEEELCRAVRYCHLRGVRIYVTVNTLVWDSEADEVIDYARRLYKMGVDALIVADLGVLRLIHEQLPDFELHASTQMSVYNTLGADEAYRLGASRVVVARELSREDIKAVVRGSMAEIEVFLHGALCVCYSGQCLFSSLVGGRSGNRGECAQPCRLPYNGKYPLSLSDLSLAGHIPELIESGVASLKIEGRMKSADYVYRVTAIYRRLLDEGRAANARERDELMRAFSRSGFTDGYFTNRYEKMLGIRRAEDKESSREADGREYREIKTQVKARATFRLYEPSELTLYSAEKSVTVTGDAPVPAERAPLVPSDVRRRLSKMGNTLLSLAEGDIELLLDEGINLSPAKINELRRRAAEQLESAERLLPPAAKTEKSGGVSHSDALNTALFLRPELLCALSCEAREFFDVIFVPLMSFDGAPGINGVYIPPIVTDSELAEIKAALKNAKGQGARYALVGNISHIKMADEAGLTTIADFRMNIANAAASRELSTLGVNCQIASAELSLHQLSRLCEESAARLGAVVYGRIPLMLTERCFAKECSGCDKCGKASLVDRRGVCFPIVREYKHRNLILNSAVTYMGDKEREFRRAGISVRHFIFTIESKQDAEAVIRAYKSGGEYPMPAVPMRRLGKRESTK